MTNIEALRQRISTMNPSIQYAPDFTSTHQAQKVSDRQIAIMRLLTAEGVRLADIAAAMKMTPEKVRYHARGRTGKHIIKPAPVKSPMAKNPKPTKQQIVRLRKLVYNYDWTIADAAQETGLGYGVARSAVRWESYKYYGGAGSPTESKQQRRRVTSAPSVGRTCRRCEVQCDKQYCDACSYEQTRKYTPYQRRLAARFEGVQ